MHLVRSHSKTNGCARRWASGAGLAVAAAWKRDETAGVGLARLGCDVQHRPVLTQPLSLSVSTAWARRGEELRNGHVLDALIAAYTGSWARRDRSVHRRTSIRRPVGSGSRPYQSRPDGYEKALPRCGSANRGRSPETSTQGRRRRRETPRRPCRTACGPAHRLRGTPVGASMGVIR